MYDVSTECCDDPYQPVVGRPFTVWLSNALAPVSLFLTTSSRGCETGRHILDDTGKMHVSWRQRSFSFVTYTEPQQRVFLCLKEEGLDDYVLVPHRSLIDVANDSAKQFFTIVQGKDGVASTNVSSRQTNPPEVPTPVNAGAHTGSGAEAQWMMLLVVVMLILGASMCVRVNFFAMHTGRNDRRVCRRTQVCEEEREELVPR
ncbi:hypothetical protein DQ04_02301070 [Trypanosoma grayi]|uniref:hypothetical protein n=1 Tax=Trypanosoma grayi TaxID=71804 RepID=UPI0004F47BC7|nr:hypothetical protein DQ04_02301070 [Trypanosoma grayi]KEG11768.1 hypothetical protein DQ04_02301070 [Trypanosoma grayi]